jgi:hypothetical protein
MSAVFDGFPSDDKNAVAFQYLLSGTEYPRHRRGLWPERGLSRAASMSISSTFPAIGHAGYL